MKHCLSCLIYYIIHNYDVFVIISVVSSIESDQIGLKTVEKNLSDEFFS